MRKWMKSKRVLVTGGIAAAVLLTAAVVLSVNIREIEVEGNRRYSKEQIVQMLFSGKWDRNTAYRFYRDKFEPHPQIPFIEDYELVFHGLSGVEVIVYEKSVVGYVSYMGSYMYFDKDGIIVESSGEKLEGVPWVTGLKFGHIVLNRPLPVENDKIFSQILDLTQVLSSYEIGVDKIRYDSHGHASLELGGLEVILGSGDEMSGKVGELNSMLPVLAGRKGTLYLDTYNEANPVSSYRFIEKKP